MSAPDAPRDVPAEGPQIAECGHEGIAVKWNPWNEVVQCHVCGTVYRPEQQARQAALDDLAAAMSEAYTYEDRDNSIPTLPFADDFDAFWDPFAVAVLDRLSGSRP